jgi:predicted glycoside hydrolase/deacetylase ChbG (UPF0249 family)
VQHGGEAPVRVIVHADDLGLHASSTEGMLRLGARGCLDRVSLVANGEAFGRAAARLAGDGGLPWSVHLNLVEGKSVSPREAVPLLVDAEGSFRLGFVGLWVLYTFRPRLRRELTGQIGRELGAQVRRVREALPDGRLRLDSHQHVHLLPFVFRIILARAAAWNVASIRLATEPWVLPPPTREGLACLCSTNVVKHLVLRRCSARCRRAAEGSGIVLPDYIVGILHSGRMSLSVARRALRVIAASNRGKDPEVELLFHPCAARLHEARVWNSSPRSRRFYLSADRSKEAQTLASPGFRRCIVRIREAAR